MATDAKKLDECIKATKIWVKESKALARLTDKIEDPKKKKELFERLRKNEEFIKKTIMLAMEVRHLDLFENFAELFLDHKMHPDIEEDIFFLHRMYRTLYLCVFKAEDRDIFDQYERDIICKIQVIMNRVRFNPFAPAFISENTNEMFLIMRHALNARNSLALSIAHLNHRRYKSEKITYKFFQPILGDYLFFLTLKAHNNMSKDVTLEKSIENEKEHASKLLVAMYAPKVKTKTKESDEENKSQEEDEARKRDVSFMISLEISDFLDGMLKEALANPYFSGECSQNCVNF